ncbi:MAG: tRNA (N6-isopentenyl adenosine(37)-C2)-methylthiotransferase MiaB [Planctomycetes bacterium]|nr:tRNA (N6-isopentenyl adenosine(37)-C2)-methylthiotransferase MiaB [Planctomycetota bacterium]
MRIFIETMGCQMNKLDSELAAGALRAAGHEIVEDRRQADAVVYNTCSVRQHAEQKVLSRIGADAQRKESGKRLLVAVIGCMAQRMGESLRRKYPAVDVVCSPGRLFDLPELLARAAAGAGGVSLDPARPAGPGEDDIARMDDLDLARDVSAAAGQSQAFVRVMRGCDFFCSYCIVPFVRGPEHSRDPSHVVQEVGRLVQAGRSEITLLGQTVNSYHWAGSGRAVRFSDLLAAVSAVPGLRRLRFVTSHPTDFGDDILQAMRDLPNVCPYIHCPAQSGSDAVLTRMNRGYTRRQYDEFVDRARTIVPGVVLAGDFIVGFPGETQEDHQASADLIRRSGYKNSFIFKYSARPGTPAAKKYADDIPQAVKARRNNELLAVQEEAGLAHHRQYVGKTVDVLVEGPSASAKKTARRKHESSSSPNPPIHASATGVSAAAPAAVQLMGRTTGDHIVVFDGLATLSGRYVNVQITDATSLTLLGCL